MIFIISGSEIKPVHEDHLSYFAQMSLRLPADRDLSSPQIKLITEWIQAFQQRNVDMAVKPLHKDFRR